MNNPTTIKLFLVGGQSDGLRTAEISNWSGLAIAGPRSDLSSLKSRADLKSPGVYILIGEDEETGLSKLYIGQSENVGKRIGSKDHAAKEFWISAICFVSKDNNLTKGHINYLEGRLISKAKELGVRVENGQGSGSPLPESDIADMEQYLSKVFQLLPILGLKTFETPVNIPPESEDWLYCFIKGLQAKGRRTAGGFLVAAGSQAVLEHRQSSKRMRVKRDELISSGQLLKHENHLQFAVDIEFGSPSTAGGIVKGGNTNGLTAWKDKNGKSLKEIEVSK